MNDHEERGNQIIYSGALDKIIEKEIGFANSQNNFEPTKEAKADKKPDRPLYHLCPASFK